MALCVNQSGTWREITTNCVNVSGTWRNIQTACINQSGTWRCYGVVDPLLGTSCGGGFIICRASSINWIVAPAATEVSRSFGGRNDAVTTAQASAACGDWFVPTVGQLQNPGYTCRTYWDSYSTTVYWSSSPSPSGFAWSVNFTDGAGNFSYGTASFCVRAFRCATY